MRNILLAVSFGIAVSAVAAPTVSNVTMPQPQYMSMFEETITIGYDLSGETAIVTLDILTNGVSIGAANVVSISGDVNRKVAPGAGKSIVWQAYKDWPEHKITNRVVQAKVTAWSLDNPPDVMVVDLLEKSNVVFYAALEQLPGGVTNDLYKTDKLVMRKIPAGGSVFTMGATIVENTTGTGGSRPRFVAFTNDFYLGVYEVTQKQLFNVSGERGTSNYTGRANSDLLPCDTVGWGRTGSMTQSSLRDWHTAANNQGTVSFSLAGNSILGEFAKFSGICFDLPTLAQWEFACRAGTSTKFNNGSMDDATMDELGWYNGNSTNEATNVAEPHPVGLKEPNAFSLYDMHGNVWEWVLDWQYSDTYNPYTEYDIEPTGPTSHASNVKRRCGGGANSPGSTCAVIYSSHRYVNAAGGDFSGFRLWAPAKMW